MSIMSIMSVILAVEDERFVRDTVCRILARKGYRVLAASDGVTALELAAQDQPNRASVSGKAGTAGTDSYHDRKGLCG